MYVLILYRTDGDAIEQYLSSDEDDEDEEGDD
jgi:hypothetical protein